MCACRFAAGEYLDAAFLTKLMCVGRELHDFLTLPAQVRHTTQRDSFAAVRWGCPASDVALPPSAALQDILIAMGK